MYALHENVILVTAFATFIIVLVMPSARAGEPDQVESTARMINSVLATLKGAQTIAICDFKLPEGTVIVRVLRGDPKRVGQLWNSTMFPRKAILAYERVNDHLGGGSATLMEIGHFELDQSKKFIVRDSFIVLDSKSSGASRIERILIPIDEIGKALVKEMAEPSSP
jgi:hypothetical protein